MMKFKSVLLLILFFSLASSSCFKHRRQIRVRNNYASPLAVTVGPADFGSVGSVKTTEYKDIPKGKLVVGGDIDGTIDVPGGKHLYTLYINSGGAVSLIEEKK
jgi:hypothetical protein